jgi:ABC-2 type transport system permease protein
MSTPSTAIPESSGAPPVVLAATSPPRPFYWSVRREFWENRSLYLAPLAVAGVLLFGSLITLAHLPMKVRALSALNPAQQHHAIATHYDVAAGVMMITTILVSVFYCLDALHGERRDRSILFWKSLPVSDLTTVLAKAIVPIIIVPVITSVIGAVLQLIMLLVSSAVLLASGLSAGVLWTQLPWFRMSFLLLYHMLTAHGLWPAPIYGYLLLVSGWARRATFLWATLPVVAIAGIEAFAFHSSHFITLVGRRFIGDVAVHPSMPRGVYIFPTNPMTHIAPATFLGSPDLWIGLAITAAFLAAAVQLRRHQGPI